MTEKKCKRCEETKPLTEFYYQSREKNIKQAICKKCGNKETNEWKKKNKERARDTRIKQKIIRTIVKLTTRFHSDD